LGTFTSVVGSWTVPKVVAPTKKKRANRFSSTWVGIDGACNNDLIQAGTEQDWYRRSTAYQAWWEILPAAETPISNPVSPGDSMTVTIVQTSTKVTVPAHGRHGVATTEYLWQVTVKDTTKGWTFTTTQPYNGPGSSAEWVQEAPTIGRRLATLADDSTVTFDHGLVNGLNPALTTAGRMVMVSSAYVPIETPSVPNPNGDGFAVAYGSVAPPAPSS
jgi:hypothetical protein